MFSLFGFLWSLVIGVISGYLANKFMGNDTSSLTGNLVLGIIGSIVGGIVAGLIGLGATNTLGSIIISVIGACLALLIYKKFIQK